MTDESVAGSRALLLLRRRRHRRLFVFPEHVHAEREERGEHDEHQRKEVAVVVRTPDVRLHEVVEEHVLEVAVDQVSPGIVAAAAAAALARKWLFSVFHPPIDRPNLVSRRYAMKRKLLFAGDRNVEDDDDDDDDDMRRARAANAHFQALLGLGGESSLPQAQEEGFSTLSESRAQESALRAKYTQMFPQRRRDVSGGGSGLMDLRPQDRYLPRRSVHEVRMHDLREQERREQGIAAAITIVGLSLLLALLHGRVSRSGGK